MLSVIHRSFLFTLSVAFVAGGILAFFAVRTLLSLAFTTHIHSYLPAIAAAVVCLGAVAIATIGYRLSKAIRTNPATILRNE